MSRAATTFTVSKLTNPSGEIVYRVSGWLDGNRIHRKFSTRAESAAEKQMLEPKAMQANTILRTTSPRLTNE